MRVSFLAIFGLVPLSFAAPILSNRGFLSDIGGIAGAVKQSVENPKLTLARLQVVTSLASTQSSLSKISAQANSTGNAGVTSLVATAQQNLSAAHDAVNRIGQSILQGATPSKTDQKDTAVGIKGTSGAINAMNAAITTPDQTLSNDIAGGVTNVAGLEQAGENILSAAGLSFADLGLPDNFATS